MDCSARQRQSVPTQRVILQLLATEGEDGGRIKNAVERAEQYVILAEDFPPVGGVLVDSRMLKRRSSAGCNHEFRCWIAKYHRLVR